MFWQRNWRSIHFRSVILVGSFSPPPTFLFAMQRTGICSRGKKRRKTKKTKKKKGEIPLCIDPAGVVCVYADCMYKRDGRRWARARRAQRPALVVERFRYSGSGAATQAAGGYGGGEGTASAASAAAPRTQPSNNKSIKRRSIDYYTHLLPLNIFVLLTMSNFSTPPPPPEKQTVNGMFIQ